MTLRLRSQHQLCCTDCVILLLYSQYQLLPGTSMEPSFPSNLLVGFAGAGLSCPLGILIALSARETKRGLSQVVQSDMVWFLFTLPRSIVHDPQYLIGIRDEIHIVLPFAPFKHFFCSFIPSFSPMSMPHRLLGCEARWTDALLSMQSTLVATTDGRPLDVWNPIFRNIHREAFESAPRGPREGQRSRDWKLDLSKQNDRSK